MDLKVPNRKIILYMASSIDGFIASTDGSVDWLDTEAEFEEKYQFKTFLNSIDTILMGRKSYEQAVSFGEWPWKTQRILVFTKSTFEAQTPNTEVISKPTPDFIRSLKMGNGKDIWLFGGATLNHYFLENDLIDEIMLFIQPTIIGAGIGIFGNQPVNPKRFKRMQTKELGGGFTLLSYQFPGSENHQ